MKSEHELAAYPYPLRPIEFANHIAEIATTTPLELSPEDIADLQGFEKSLHKRFTQTTKNRSNTHAIYPAALTDQVGSLLTYATYLDTARIKSYIDTLAKEHQLNLKSVKQAKALYAAFYQDLEASFHVDQVLDQSVSTHTYTISPHETIKAIHKLTKKNSPETPDTLQVPTLDITLPTHTLEESEVRDMFRQANMADIPFQMRSQLHNFSTSRAKDHFVAQVESDITPDIPDSICRLTKPAALLKRIAELRSFKAYLKDIDLIDSTSTPLTEAKQIIVDLYREQANVLLARSLILLSGTGPTGADIMVKASRQVSRFDRFLEGASTEFDEHGMARQISPRVEKLLHNLPPQESRQIYPAVDTQDTIDLAVIIAALHQVKIDIKPRHTNIGSFRVAKSSLHIPKKVNLPVDEVLVSLSHEIEGHLLTRKRRIKPNYKLKLFSSTVYGIRHDVLSETAGKWAEDVTREQITGQKPIPNTFVYEGLQAKLNHGNFLDVYQAIFIDLQASSPHLDRQEIIKKAYDRAHRLFRHHTPTSDSSGYITTSNQLKYTEQKAVGDALQDHNLLGVALYRGIDQYRLSRILRLGVFKRDDLKPVELVTGTTLWSAIKRGLDDGQDIKQIITSLKAEYSHLKSKATIA